MSGASLFDDILDLLTDYRAFRHVIDNFDDEDLANLKAHLATVTDPALRAAHEAGVEAAAKLLEEDGWLAMPDILRSLKSPSSVPAVIEGEKK